jgi:hypothetical protein
LLRKKKRVKACSGMVDASNGLGKKKSGSIRKQAHAAI